MLRHQDDEQQQPRLDPTTTTQQLQHARDYLATLHGDRAASCSDLEEEAKVFLGSPSTEEQARRFRLIYQLMRYQVGGLTLSEIVSKCLDYSKQDTVVVLSTM